MQLFEEVSASDPEFAEYNAKKEIVHSTLLTADNCKTVARDTGMLMFETFPHFQFDKRPRTALGIMSTNGTPIYIGNYVCIDANSGYVHGMTPGVHDRLYAEAMKENSE